MTVCRRVIINLLINYLWILIWKKMEYSCSNIWLVCVKALLLHPLSERVEAQWLTWWTKRRCCRKKTSIKIWKWLDKVFIFAVRTARKGASFSESGFPFARERMTAESLEIKKKLPKNLAVKNKVFTFASAFEKMEIRSKFFEILINNTSSTSNKRTVNTYNNRYLKSRWITESWTELKHQRHVDKRYYYNEEFDPGSGWTLATGLTHASRGAAWS